MNLFVVAVLLGCLLGSLTASDPECPIVPSGGEDRRADKKSLRIMQYNVEWLFLDQYKSCPGSGCTWANITEAEIHLQTVSNVVKELSPDILNICEIEGCDELDALRNSLRDTSYRGYLKKGTDTGTGQNVGMLTRIDPQVSLYRTEDRFEYPIANSKCGSTYAPSTTGVSKHFITEFAINDLKIAMISAHLVAIPTDPSRCAQREGQASVLQSVIANYASAGYEIIVLGDFNDYDGQVLDMNSHVPTSQVLEILKGHAGESAGKYELFPVSANIPQKQRFSDWYDSDNNCATNTKEDYSMIDHLLVTPGLQGKIVNTFIFHGYKGSCETYNSDHYPLVIDLKL